jgi:hypothetical protein
LQGTKKEIPGCDETRDGPYPAPIGQEPSRQTIPVSAKRHKVFRCFSVLLLEAKLFGQFFPFFIISNQVVFLIISFFVQKNSLVKKEDSFDKKKK